jgi:16S rRNA processing protein RimM
MEGPTVAVGRIARAHGVHGEVSVVVLTEVAERFAPGSVVFLQDGRPLTVRGSRPDRDRLLVRFEEVHDRTEAEALRTSLLVVPASSSPPLPEGSWWDHEIEGCEVRVETGRALGRVRGVIHTRANDVWSIEDDDGTETLVPVLAEVLVSVDVGAKEIVVREIPGLTDDA